MAFAIAIIAPLARQPAAAEIVYTPTNVVLTLNQSYDLDLNDHGTVDFIIKAARRNDQCGGVSASLNMTPVAGSGVEGSHTTAALDAGSVIGRDQKFNLADPLIQSLIYGEFFVCGSVRCGECVFRDIEQGNWLNVSGFLGLKFEIDRETHYGWAQLTVRFDHKSRIELFSGTLTGYAYETIPGRSIVAGQTSGTFQHLEP